MAQTEVITVKGKDDASDEFDKVDKSFQKLSGGIKKAAQIGGIAIGAKKLFDLGAAALQAAVDGAEAAEAFKTTFGGAIGDISEFVDEFANKAGLSTAGLQQMLAVTGNVAQGLGATEREAAAMSEQMARLAGDVASFSNASGGAEAVLRALQSATTGEREALKTYGIVISEAAVQAEALRATNKQSADELTALEKAQATMTLAYERAGKAVGDLDRTQDSAANTQRRVMAVLDDMRGQVGAALIPALERLLPLFESMIPTIGEFATGLFGALAGLAPLATGISRLLLPVLKTTADYLKLVGDGLNAIWAIAGDQAAQATIRYAEAQENLNTTLADGGDVSVALANSLVHLLTSTGLTTEQLHELEAASGLSEERLGDVRREVELWAIANGVAAPAIEDLSDSVTASLPGMAELNARIIANSEANQAAAIEAEEFADANDRARTRANNYRTMVQSLTGDLLAAVEAQESVNDVLRRATDPVYDAIRSYEDYQTTLADVNEDNKITATEFFELTRAEMDLKAAFENVSPAEYESAMLAFRLATGKTRDEIEELLDQLGDFDGSTFTGNIKLNYPPAFNPNGPTQDIVASVVKAGGFREGGMTPGGENDASLALVHGQERIFSAPDNRELLDLLRAIAANSGPTVNVGGVNVTSPSPDIETAAATGAARGAIEAILS